MPLSAQQPETRTSSSYGVASEHTTTTAVVLSQQDNLLSTMATHQSATHQSPLGAVVGGHKRNSSLQTEHHEVYVAYTNDVLCNFFSILVLNQRILYCREDHMILVLTLQIILCWGKLHLAHLLWIYHGLDQVTYPSPVHYLYHHGLNRYRHLGNNHHHRWNYPHQELNPTLQQYHRYELQYSLICNHCVKF